MPVQNKPSTEESLSAFHARSREYLRHGYDRLAAARFVVDTAGTLSGPALDVGTGKGLLAIELARKGLEVVTIDLDAQERELARRLADQAGVAARITYETGDAARLPCADGRFGCVAMMDVLHHLEQPEPVLREMARVTSPGGIGIVADFDEEGFRILSQVHRLEGREHPRTDTTVFSALAVLIAVGFAPLASVQGHHHEIAVLRKNTPREYPTP